METSPAVLTEVIAQYSSYVPELAKIDEAQIDMLAQYCQLAWTWNEKINLTRHTDFDMFVKRDLVDTLALARHINPNERVMDVGSGGGVPGVLLKILRPDLHIDLCESVNKMANCLVDIVAQLELRCDVYIGRAEDVLPDVRYNTLTFRAVAKMAKILEWMRPQMNSFDRMLLIKGPSWVEERGEARHYGMMTNMALRKLEEYTLPNTATATQPDAVSVILQICHKTRLNEDGSVSFTQWERNTQRPRRRQRPGGKKGEEN